jgi:RHS repeat-associated protein
MQTAYNQPGVSLTYANGGLDRYGRVVNHSWVKNNNPLVHIIHSYDYAGNRTKRYDAVHAANSELYTYDQLGQIKSLDRGTLNIAQTSVANVVHSESWNFDKTGNWLQYIKNGNTENRTHNAANELQGVATHDANGNMTLMPGLKGKYDAWNRLVEVKDSNDNLIANYEYNGLNQRIKKTVGSTLTKSFFNEQWQEVESVTNLQVTSYVWGLRYIDDLVLREKGTEKLYSLADPNWNVVGICDNIGDVQERYTYDAFGKRNVFEDNFVAKNASDFNWDLAFTGQVIDVETGLMLYRNRFYSTGLGRFINRDPISYTSYDSNLYRYIRNAAMLFVDPFGYVKMEIDVIIQREYWQGDHAGGYYDTITIPYRVTIDYTAECVDGMPYVALNSITGNLLWQLDTIGFNYKKVFAFGYGIDLEYKEIPTSNQQCPDGMIGGIEKRMYSIEIFTWQGIRLGTTGQWFHFRQREAFFTVPIEVRCCRCPLGDEEEPEWEWHDDGHCNGGYYCPVIKK